MSKYSNHVIFRSHDQVTERLKELTAKSSVKPPRPPNPPPAVASVSTQRGVAKGTQQHNKQQVDTQAELLYQINEGVSVDHVIKAMMSL